MPRCPKPKDPKVDRFQPKPGDSAAVAAWRVRMETEQAKAISKERAATAECVNALARGRALVQLTVRGRLQALAVALWHALAHNVLCAVRLRAARLQAAVAQVACGAPIRGPRGPEGPVTPVHSRTKRQRSGIGSKRGHLRSQGQRIVRVERSAIEGHNGYSFTDSQRRRCWLREERN